MAVGGPRTLFLGMTGAFSLGVLRAFRKAGGQVSAVVVPGLRTGARAAATGRSSPLPVLNPFLQRSIIDEAVDAEIPVYDVGVNGWGTLRILMTSTRVPVDAIAVACFPRLVPASLRDMAPIGAVNVHPSLLPDNRGPDPLFWTFRRGLTRTGVTIHQLTDQLDAGDIVSQEAFDVADGIGGRELEAQAAAVGGRLLATALRDMGYGGWSGFAQNEAEATNYGFADDADWAVPLQWEARRAYNFMCGVADRGGPLRIEVEHGVLPVARPVQLDLATSPGMPRRIDRDLVVVPFHGGDVTVALKAELSGA
jgi:methionyl-tRNA formyltransferase